MMSHNSHLFLPYNALFLTFNCMVKVVNLWVRVSKGWSWWLGCCVILISPFSWNWEILRVGQFLFKLVSALSSGQSDLESLPMMCSSNSWCVEGERMWSSCDFVQILWPFWWVDLLRFSISLFVSNWVSLRPFEQALSRSLSILPCSTAMRADTLFP